MKNFLSAGLLTSAFLVFHSDLTAQKNFQAAQVVNNDGDTLNGQVNYQNWKRNPSRIQFRQKESDQTVNYRPTDIKWFTVANEKYTSAIVMVDQREDHIGALVEDSTINLKTDTVFLFSMVEGTKSLFLYEDAVMHFYIKEDNDFTLLRYKKFLVTRNNSTFATTRTDYITQLGNYLGGCTATTDAIAKAKYEQQALRKAFGSYYSCKQAKPVYVFKPIREKSPWGVFAGFSNTKLSFRSSDNYEIVKTSFKSSLNFTAGAFYDFIIPRTLSKVSINNELGYSSYKTTAYHETIRSANYYAKSSYEMGFSYVKLYNMLRYRYLLGNNNSVFANLGISNGFGFNVTNQASTVSKFYTTERTERGAAIHEPRKYEQGWVAGLGVKAKQYLGELRLERSNGMSALQNLSSPVVRTSVLVSYSFR
ncbi:MAG TPA: outer membrane beta-barrel protein [Flavitalea sp.]|nr:outer membrane beta-barrel protein [Flavitalea sp.]